METTHGPAKAVPRCARPHAHRCTPSDRLSSWALTAFLAVTALAWGCNGKAHKTSQGKTGETKSPHPASRTAPPTRAAPKRAQARTHGKAADAGTPASPAAPKGPMPASAFQPTVPKPKTRDLKAVLRAKTGPDQKLKVWRPIPLGGPRFVVPVAGRPKGGLEVSIRLVTFEKQGDRWQIIDDVPVERVDLPSPQTWKRLYARAKVGDFDADGRPEAELSYRIPAGPEAGNLFRKVVLVNLLDAKPRIAAHLTLHDLMPGRMVDQRGAIRFEDKNGDGHPDILLTLILVRQLLAPLEKNDMWKIQKPRLPGRARRVQANQPQARPSSASRPPGNAPSRNRPRLATRRPRPAAARNTASSARPIPSPRAQAARSPARQGARPGGNVSASLPGKGKIPFRLVTKKRGSRIHLLWNPQTDRWEWPKKFEQLPPPMQIDVRHISGEGGGSLGMLWAQEADEECMSVSCLDIWGLPAMTRDGRTAVVIWSYALFSSWLGAGETLPNAGVTADLVDLPSGKVKESVSLIDEGTHSGLYRATQDPDCVNGGDDGEDDDEGGFDPRLCEQDPGLVTEAESDARQGIADSVKKLAGFLPRTEYALLVPLDPMKCNTEDDVPRLPQQGPVRNLRVSPVTGTPHHWKVAIKSIPEGRILASHEFSTEDPAEQLWVWLEPRSKKVILVFQEAANPGYEKTYYAAVQLPATTPIQFGPPNM